MPRAAQARATWTNGAGGKARRHRSRRRSAPRRRARRRTRRRARRRACTAPTRPRSSRARDTSSARSPPPRALAIPNSSVRWPSRPRGRLVDRLWIERTGGLPEGAQRAFPARVIPHARGDDAAGPDDARHLVEARHGIGHEVDDELGERGVECPVLERQVLRGRLPDLGAGVSLPHRVHEGVGWIDRRDRSGPTRATSSAVSAPGPHPTSTTR